MKNTVIVNIYNFIRMSHVEPSVFIQDDFDTVRKQMTLIRQYDFPATYALKYDALMEPRYQELVRTYAGDGDEISAWWEITEPLCRRAGVAFRGARTEEFDERVDSAYSIGYAPEERRRLVDAYMEDFRNVFGFYPRTIGSWVLDTVTISYAAEKYGILGSAICRDQMGTDGFTLWGGFPNGIYYPSRSNENIPAGTLEGQLSVPMFRLLGPDPIYNFEQDVRSGLQGVYTLEPSWLIGRNPEWISWFFDCLTKEDVLGIGYAHVGQENNFLWENISPGMEPQLKKLKDLLSEKSIKVETMAESARWFRDHFRLTPPMSFQASGDWDAQRNLSAQWYACGNFRVGFLGEKGHLRIRDFFIYRQEYPSRYLEAPMTSKKSVFDALPVLFPQRWMGQNDGRSDGQNGGRPFIRLADADGQEPEGVMRYKTVDRLTARAELWNTEKNRLLAAFTMQPDRIVLEGDYKLCFDVLPVFRFCEAGTIHLEHESFSYSFAVSEGRICRAEKSGLEIVPVQGRICLNLGEKVEAEDIFIAAPQSAAQNKTDEVQPKIFVRENKRIPVPPREPVAEPGDCVFPAGSTGNVRLAVCMDGKADLSGKAYTGMGEIRYTLDGSEPTPESPLYTEPLKLREDTMVSARLFLPDGRSSETAIWQYRFGIQGIRLTSPTVFDRRPVFCGRGVEDFLNPRRGSLDYLDGRWRGTLQDLEICGILPENMYVRAVTAGFLSHHRAGIVFPESVQLFTGPDEEHLVLTSEMAIPCRPCTREIARQDMILPVGREIGSFRLIAHRYEKMPDWCCYRGSRGVFTMADNVIVSS
ncbi:MAG: hypothetical protein HDR26_00390 [Lachnospiraceae bacterium]|nr:hypothetical protein [Lachnospiraceae bacterium]